MAADYTGHRRAVVVAIEGLPNRPLFGYGWDELAVYDLVVALLHHTGFFGLAAFSLLLLHAMAGEFVLPRSAMRSEEERVLRSGLQLTLWGVVAVDLVSGFSYVSGNFWIILGLALASVRPLRWVVPSPTARGFRRA